MGMPLGRRKAAQPAQPAPRRTGRTRGVGDRPEMKPGSLYTIEEAALAARCRDQKVRDAVRSGELPPVKTGRANLILGADLLRWVKGQK